MKYFNTFPEKGIHNECEEGCSVHCPWCFRQRPTKGRVFCSPECIESRRVDLYWAERCKYIQKNKK